MAETSVQNQLHLGEHHQPELAPDGLWQDLTEVAAIPESLEKWLRHLQSNHILALRRDELCFLGLAVLVTELSCLHAEVSVLHSDWAAGTAYWSGDY